MATMDDAPRSMGALARGLSKAIARTALEGVR
jgi:hypothetical protein